MVRKSVLVLVVGLCAFAAACTGLSRDVRPDETTQGIPLIDRELFFGDPEISRPNLSPDGKYIAFIKPYQKVRNIWVKGIDESFEQARPVTADTRPVMAYFWSRDAKYILYVQDKDGNENFHIYAVDPRSDADGDTGVPAARNLTDIKGVRAAIYSVPKSKPGEIIVGLNDRDPAYSDVYKIDLSTGKRTLLIKNTQQVASFIYDLHGNVRLAVRQTEDAGTEILKVAGDQLTKIYTCVFGESCYPIRFHKDARRCYIVTNRGEQVDRSGLALLDVESGEVESIESDPEKQVDFGEAVFSEATDELIATVYAGDRSRIYPKNDRVRRDLDIFKTKLPKGELRLLSVTRDMDLMLVSVVRDVDVGSVFLYDRRSEEVRLLYRVRPELSSEHLAFMQPVRYKARDGVEIPAYLTLPRGVEPKNLPTVIYPHGGPWARDYWGPEPFVQFLANRGYAVLQPNFRGSTGYGKHFTNLGDRQWGRGTMQHDITDGVKWLIKKGISDPKRVGIFGGSYGGYVTLAGAAFTPDLFACGVPYVAPSNLITLIESFPAYWKPFIKMIHKRLGDPENQKDREYLKSVSPLHHADAIKIPLLVVQGANDPRVKQAESDSIVVALDSKGHDVVYLLAPDEGHGFRSPDNNLALAAAMEKFLAKHLKGRYQRQMSPEIEQKLTALTVDPKSIKLPGELEKERLAKAAIAPLPKADGSLIQTATLKYNVKMSIGEKQLDAEMNRVVESIEVKKAKRLRITSTTTMPQGKQKEVFELDRNTLKPILRSVSGMADMTIHFADNAVTGNIKAGGMSVPIKKSLDAPVLGDGAGLELVIAGLPLEKDYSTTLRLFDLLTQKVRFMSLEVLGKQRTQSAAGEYETWIVSLKSLDGEKSFGATLRVMEKAPHHVVESEYKLPAALGGGTVKSGLLEIIEN